MLLLRLLALTTIGSAVIVGLCFVDLLITAATALGGGIYDGPLATQTVVTWLFPAASDLPPALSPDLDVTEVMGSE